MKELAILIFLTISWILLPSTSEAQIWIVNNNPGGAGHFDNIQDASDNIENGDTLYIVPSITTYDNITVDKEVHLIGNGYLLGENGIEGSSKKSNLGGIRFDDGSEFSSITGLYVDGIVIATNDISVTKTYVTSVWAFYNVYRTTITNSYIQNGIFDFDNNNAIFIDIYLSNSFVEYIDNISGTITNNIISNNIDNISDSIISNSIFLSDNISDIFSINSENENYNNIFTISEPSNSGIDNQFNIDPSTLFVGPDGNSADAQWQLSEISPAIGTGTNGDDIGMYGGANPYQLSGLPDIPRITAFTAPATGSANTGLPVSITIESNN